MTTAYDENFPTYTAEEFEMHKPLYFWGKRHKSFEKIGNDARPDYYSPLRHFVITDEYMRYDFIALNKLEALAYYIGIGKKMNALVKVFVLDPIPNSMDVTVNQMKLF